MLKRAILFAVLFALAGSAAPPWGKGFLSFASRGSMFRPLLNSLWFRLLLGFAVPLIMFLGAACVSYFSIQRLLNSLEHEQISQKILTKIFEAKDNLEGMAAAKHAHHLLGEPEIQQTFE